VVDFPGDLAAGAKSVAVLPPLLLPHDEWAQASAPSGPVERAKPCAGPSRASGRAVCWAELA
jgi:hypothetical protein